MLRLNRFSLLVALLLSLSAAAQMPAGKSSAAARSTLNSALFYQILLGEINARADDPASAHALLLDAARKSFDAGLYQRAVEVALQARSGESALAAARAWRHALPNSRAANQFLLQILIGLNRIGETLEPLKREIAATEAPGKAAAIAAIPRYYARASDKPLASRTVEQALAQYLSQPGLGVSAWVAIGRMHLAAGQVDDALQAARKASLLDADAQAPVWLALALLATHSAQAEALVQQFLGAHTAPELRMEYARVLINSQRHQEALAQLESVTAGPNPGTQAWLMTGMLQLKLEQPQAAEKSLKRFLELAAPPAGAAAQAGSARGFTQAYEALAQIAEQKKDYQAADDWLQRIDRGEDKLSAQLQRAALLARQGKIDAARQLIATQQPHSAQDERLKMTAEIDLLRDAKRYREAYQLLVQASTHFPDDMDLLYDQAMMAEKLNQLQEMEDLLRRVIAARPESAHAYNALGYALADHGLRLDEARQLVLQALSFAPGDAFISDSLGWVEFRSGNLSLAKSILERALQLRADAEIAAHLGEVLWRMAQPEAAIKVWQQGWQINASNETLLETLKRLQVKL